MIFLPDLLQMLLQLFLQAKLQLRILLLLARQFQLVLLKPLPSVGSIFFKGNSGLFRFVVLLPRLLPLVSETRIRF